MAEILAAQCASKGIKTAARRLNERDGGATETTSGRESVGWSVGSFRPRSNAGGLIN